MGIDPGTLAMGYGVIKVAGRTPALAGMGVVELKKCADPYLKLQKIFERVTQLISEYLPDEVAIESPFFGKNVQSMLKLGRAQGVAIAAALSRGVPVCEYAPRRIKQMITGQGEASKEQVAAMLKSMFAVQEMPAALDASDGLAAAVCHFYSTTSANAQLAAAKKKQPKKTAAPSWGKFVAQNPQLVK
jgi:crossover junction endodeoxyribonuclease RuvC